MHVTHKAGQNMPAITSKSTHPAVSQLKQGAAGQCQAHTYQPPTILARALQGNAKHSRYCHTC